MRKWMLTLLVLGLVAGCRPPSSGHRAPPTPLATGVTAFEHVNVLRMDRDTVLADQTVIVRDGRIEEIGPARSIRGRLGASRIDGRGRYLMPALADMHVQLSPSFWRVRREMTLYVTYGVALVRNLDGRSPHLRWRERVRSGEVFGPKIVTCGPPIGSDTSLIGRSDDMLGNRVAALGTSVERMLRDQRPVVSIRPEVMDQRHDGYDCIAVESPSDWTPARYDAVVAAARATGMPIAGDFARNLALETNLRGRTTADRFDAYLRDHLAPEIYSGPRAVQDSVARDIARRTHAAGVAVSTRLFGVAGPERALMRRLVRAFADADVRLILGTESTARSSVSPGASVHLELRDLVAAGLTPFEALRTATANPALVLGVPGEFGIIVPGARADLLLLDGSPLADIGNTERLAGVMLRGRWIPAAELRRLREEARAPRRLRGWLR